MLNPAAVAAAAAAARHPVSHFSICPEVAFLKLMDEEWVCKNISINPKITWNSAVAVYIEALFR